MATLFACPAELSAIDRPELSARCALRILTRADDRFTLDLEFVDPKGAATTLPLSLKQAHTIDDARFEYDSLTEIVTLDVDLAKPHPDFETLGLMGVDFAAEAKLSSVRIVLQPRPQGNGWTAQAPCFAVLLCWTVSARAAQTMEILAPDGRATIAAGAAASVDVCAGFSAILPQMADLGLPDLQLRLDLPSLSLSTQWVPLARFEIDSPSPFRLNGLLRWFGDLVQFDWPSLAPLAIPAEPKWELDLPLVVDLPLGFGAEETGLQLRRAHGHLVLTAWARKFYLKWHDTRLYIGGKIDLSYLDPDRYTLFAELVSAQYPHAETDPYRFALPFDLLGLAADCWYFRAGLFSAGDPGGDVGRLCFELLVEIGGLKVTSRFSGDEGSRGFYRADLRLLMRDFRVLSNRMSEIATAPIFFGAVEQPNGAFKRYVDKAIRIPALTFAQDLLAPPALGSDDGMAFLNGDCRGSERIYMLWRQKGMRFLRALAHDILGQEPGGSGSADDGATLFGLEIAQFDRGASTQIRLDWRPIVAGPPATPAQGRDAPPPILNDPPCLCVKKDGPPPSINLPLKAPGVYLDIMPADPIRFDLPAISLAVARAREQGIVLRHNADGQSSVGHLLFYPASSVKADDAAPPLAHAKFGFSLKDRESPAEPREVVETEQDGAFLTIGMGYAGSSATVLRTIGWASGQSPRFLQTIGKDGEPIGSLLPTVIPEPVSGDPGCPGQPPPALEAVSLAFDAFAAPQFAPTGWRLSIRAAALESLFKTFEGGSPRQVVKFTIVRLCESKDGRAVLISTNLTFEFGLGTDKFSATGTVTFRFDVRDLALSIGDGAELTFALDSLEQAPSWAAATPLPAPSKNYWYSEPKSLLGFEMTGLTRKDAAPPPLNGKIGVLVLSIREGRFLLALPENRCLLLRYTRLGSDSLNFWVSRFLLGPGGLDLDADLLSSTITVKGLKRPFLLEKAGLRIRSSKVDYLSVDASGRLPELLNEAPVNLTIAFAQQQAGGPVELDEMHCELGDKDTPILSRGTRFKFEITNLTINYASDAPGGERHFFFEVSGAAQFMPDADEFANGLLEDLKSARIEFLRAPLTDEFHKSLGLMVELKRPVVFNVFSLFRMEIRSIGFAPDFRQFDEPGPAVVIGGQCDFAQLGNVVSADISFHAMYIGLPATGESLPQIYFDGLRVDISSAEGFRIAGRVDRYDKPTIKGFAGEGTVQIPGFPELSAAFAFVRLWNEEQAEWQHAWFIAIEAAKISYQVGPLPIYLRQIGLGFGYRYTLPLIKIFDQNDVPLRQLIATMLKALDEHQTLARIDSWHQQSGPATWTIALEAVFTLATANTGPYAYDAAREQRLKTMVAQVLAGFRSDFTVLAALKLWYPVSVDDFFNDLDGMRRRPLVSGFMIYSVPQNRFLAYASKGQDPYMGPPNDPVPDVLKNVLRHSHFEATLLIEPGLIHGEFGWPDRLMFAMTVGSLDLECRGGVLFRLERDVLIQGTFFSARGKMNLAGAVDAGFIGVRVEAFVQVQFAVRLLTAVYLANPLDSRVYAALGLDIAVRFSISAWLRLKIGFAKINIDISFSLNLQIVVALELGWAGQGQLGFKGRAQVTIGVFGRAVGVGIAVGLNEGGVDAARAALAPYMGSLLGPGEAPAMPGINNALPNALQASPAAPATARDRDALAGTRPATDTTRSSAAIAAQSVPPPPAPAATAAAGDAIEDDYFVSAHVTGASQGDETLWFVWIMPGPGIAGFYPPTNELEGDDTLVVPYATLTLHDIPADVTAYTWSAGAWVPVNDTQPAQLGIRAHARFGVTTESGTAVSDAAMTLQKMVAGCWVPREMEDYAHQEGSQSVPFPDYWPVAGGVNLDAPQPRPYSKKNIREAWAAHDDEAERRPNRRLDLSRAYDRALMKAAELGTTQPAEAQHLADQALGNQSFLIQAFHDDLVKLADTSTFDDRGAPVSFLAAGKQRPTLLDTGMVICVKGKNKPDWINRRPAKTGPRTDAASRYPSVQFRHGPYANQDIPFLPVVDFDMVDFSRNKPVFRRARSYFDDELVALAWDLDWPGAEPAHADRADGSIEAYLRMYDISFFDLESQNVLHRCTATPTRLDVPPTDEPSTPAQSGAQPGPPGYDQLMLRYQFTIARSAIFKGLSDQRLIRVGAAVRPVSQTGQRGDVFTFELTFEPTLTPLPPDNAELVLDGGGQGKDWHATITWRQLALPPRPGIATTDGWHLILRPLRSVPLGAYPDEAVDVTDRGLMSVTGQALLDGDILIKLYTPGSDAAIGAGFTSATVISENTDAERDPADKCHTLTLAGGAIPGTVYDHRGHPQHQDSAVYQAAASFFKRESAATRNGHAWRLFLRGVHGLGDNERLKTGSGVSGLTQVRLMLRVARPSALVQPQLSQQDAAPHTVYRALPHFEWPQPLALQQVASIDAAGGPVQVALFDINGLNNEASLQFVDKPGRARVVNVVWNALSDAHGSASPAAETTGPDWPLQAYAGYDVFELPLDSLVNADSLAGSGFEPDWRWMRRIIATDAAQAAQIPSTMAEAQNWEAQYPVFARTVKLLQGTTDTADMPARWPGWYSWDDAMLQWPQRRIALPAVPDTEHLSAHTCPPPSAAQKLAIWCARGHAVAKVALHDYLAMMIGHVADHGGVGADAAYEVQVVAGRPTSLTDAIQWLAANTETLDPYGWAALSHLGLAVTVAMRDPLTGLLLPQAALRTALAAAASDIDAAASAVPDAPAAEANADELPGLAVASLKRHLLFELPIQHLRAYRAGADDARLDDAALSLLQVSLRPTSSQVAKYYVVEIARNDRPSPIPDKQVSPSVDSVRVEMRFPRMNPDAAAVRRPTILLGPSEPLQLTSAFAPGDLVVMRELTNAISSEDDFIERLNNAGLGMTRHAAFEQAPVALIGDPRADLLFSPYETFGTPLAYWLDRMVVPGNHAPSPPGHHAIAFHYNRFLDYLVDAFALSHDQTELDAARAALALQDSKAELRTRYLSWSRRFFRTAPIAGAVDLFSPERCAIVQPKTVDPLKIAADARGRLSFTRFVDEQWAGERSYAVMPIGRYERLLRSLELGTETDDVPRTPPLLSRGRADVALPRVRRLEPPKLLSARAVRSADGRQFHELIMAHAEKTLSQSNLSVSRKLSFGAIERNYLRRFRHLAWVGQLAADNKLGTLKAGLPQPQARGGGQAATLPDLDAGAQTLLSVVPQARWDATRYVDAAEAYYYQQIVRYRASASCAIVSEQKSVVLPTPAPGPLKPIGEPPVSVQRCRWDDALEQRYTQWSTALEACPPLVQWLGSSGYSIAIRWPRLIEGLDEAERATIFSYEMARYAIGGVDYAPVGYLPDPDVRVLILDVSSAGTATVAQFVAQAADGKEPTPQAPFVFTQVAAGFNVSHALPQAQRDWAEGLVARVDVRPSFSEKAVGYTEGDVPPLAVPDTLVEVRPDALPAPRELPVSGPLSQLAPLALRLRLTASVQDAMLTMIDPLAGGRWLCRPHLPPPDDIAPDAPMTQADLALGLRMVVDHDRRCAAALLAWDVAAGGGATARALLRLIEESDIALLLLHKTFDLDPGMLRKWQSAGITIWQREQDLDAARAGTWTPLERPQLQPLSFNCLLFRTVPAQSDEEEAAFEETRQAAWSILREFALPHPDFQPAMTLRLNERLDQLASLAYRPAAMREPTVFLQRGNEPRVPWPKAT